MMNPHFTLFTSLFLLLANSPLLSHSSPNDTVSLTNFRLQTDTHGNLLSNWTGPDACSSNWTGVTCSPTGRVVSLSLPSHSLRGPLDRLAALDQLRRLNLSGNRLNGTVSPVTACANLKLLYLAGNDLSGEIPPEIDNLQRILRLDLSDNNIGGTIPAEIFRLGRIVTLRLQNNVLAGEVPDLGRRAESLRELNLTNNQLYGKVPDSMLRRFGEASFGGNQGLCGTKPWPECTKENRTVPSNPSSEPGEAVAAPVTGETRRRRPGMSGGAIAAVVIGNCVAVVVIASCVVAHCCSGDRRGGGGGGSSAGSENGGKRGRRSGSGYGSGGDHKKVYADGAADSDGTTGLIITIIIII